MSETLAVLDSIQAIQRVSGNEQLAHDLLQMFIKELPEYRQTIQQALKENDREALKQIIHKMHGGLRYVSAPALAQIVSKTNAQVLTLSQSQLEQNIEQIYHEIEQVMATDSYDVS